MTPVDIEMKVFKKARFGGYHQDDVNEFLDDVIRSFEDLQRDNVALEQRIARLEEKLDYYKTMEKTLQNTMILAEKTSQETTAAAQEKAERILLEGTFKSDQMIEKARQEVYTVKQSIEDLQKQYKTSTIQMKQMLQSQLEILETQTIAIEEFNTIPEERIEMKIETSIEKELEIEIETEKEAQTETDKLEELYYTREYQIINEEDAI